MNGNLDSTLEVVGANTNILLRNTKARKQQDNINYNDTIQGTEFHKLFNEWISSYSLRIKNFI